MAVSYVAAIGSSKINAGAQRKLCAVDGDEVLFVKGEHGTLRRHCQAHGAEAMLRARARIALNNLL